MRISAVVILLTVFFWAGGCLELSSHVCTTASIDAAKVCHFQNLVLFNGELLYIVSDTTDHAGLPTNYRGAPNILRVTTEISEPQLRLLEEIHVPAAYLWAGDQCGLSGRNLQYMNYGDCVNRGIAELHATLCSTTGRCLFDSKKDLTIIDMIPNNVNTTNLPGWFVEYIGCFASNFITYNSTEQLERGQIIIIDSATAGQGQICGSYTNLNIESLCPDRETSFEHGFQYQPLLHMDTLRHRLSKCFGYTRKVSTPKVLLVDRPYNKGRHIFNSYDLVKAMHDEYGIEITLAYMEDYKTVREQAHLLSKFSIMIHVHGSVLGNYHFLPDDAVAIQVSPPIDLFNETFYPNSLVNRLRASSNLSWLPLIPKDWKYFLPDYQCVQWTNAFQSLNRERLIETLQGNCSGYEMESIPNLGFCKLIKRFCFNIVLSPEQVKEAIQEAIFIRFGTHNLSFSKPAPYMLIEARAWNEVRSSDQLFRVIYLIVSFCAGVAFGRIMCCTKGQENLV